VGESGTSWGAAGEARDVARPPAELDEAREQLAATNEILGILASSSTPDDVFGAIVQRACRLCHAQVAQIWLVQDDVYRLVRSVGLSREYVDFAARAPIPVNRSTLVGRVSLDRTTQQIADVLADPEYNRPEGQRLGGYRSILGAPMIVQDEVVGVLSVWRTSVAPFDQRVTDLLTAFAAQGALAVRNVELFHTLEARSSELGRRVEQLEALSEVGDVVNSTLDADEVLTTIVTFAVELSGTDGGSLMEYNEESMLFSVRTAFGTTSQVLDSLRGSRIHLHETLVGRACLAREPLQVHDLALVERDPHLSVLYAAGWRSLVAVPMLRGGRVVGALVVRRLTPGSFTKETCEILEAFASQSAIALTNARLYQELERQSVELAEASRHKSEFLASMSHELRTPLNAVIGFSEVLLEGMFGDLNDRQRDYLQDILSSGRHLLALLNDVLDLSKVEAGQMELEFSTFSGEDALAYGLSLVRERALAHGISLALEVPPGLGSIWADELRFKQVLLNLLSNAVKFTPDGGRVDLRAKLANGELEVTVSDTGVGIHPEDQARIFNSFQQGGRAAGRVEGTGLGLTLTKRIVELHGGRMWLRSRPGHGSTFGFAIPQDGQPEMAAAPVVHEVEPLDDSTPRVVVIEDDASSSALLSLHLEAAGLQPVAVATGEEGLEAVRVHRPVAVVLDIRLPGIDGWDVLAILKGSSDTSSIPVIVVSMIHDRGKGFALGASDYLVKPVGRVDLLTAIGRVVPLPSQASQRPVAVFLDDDMTSLQLVRLTLEAAGWSVHTFTQAAEAFAAIKAVQPSVVLVDLLMPLVDGFAVIDTLRADPDTATLPIVVLTAKTLTVEERNLLEGRIEFVTSKNAMDLSQLARRLARGELAQRARRGDTR
jgi:signal transduction histidine kinase/CheY-like chemotaxis protein